jgi:hypothetical protein
MYKPLHKALAKRCNLLCSHVQCLQSKAKGNQIIIRLQPKRDSSAAKLDPGSEFIASRKARKWLKKGLAKLVAEDGWRICFFLSSLLLRKLK